MDQRVVGKGRGAEEELASVQGGNLKRRGVYIPTMFESFSEGAEAYVSGFEAHGYGIPLAKNPHPLDAESAFSRLHVARNAWTAGWKKADETRQKSESAS